MSLNALLAEKQIKRAIIVDDACDLVPTAGDIGPDSEDWPNFNDDLREEHKGLIHEEYPDSAGMSFDELVRDDLYVAALWKIREKLGGAVSPVFAGYIADQEADQQYIDDLAALLEGFGLECERAGRDFHDPALTADLIIIDLFFNKRQDEEALNESKEKLKLSIDARRDDPPLVILMSRSSRLEEKRDEFRDEVGLLDSAFRIISKTEIHQAGRLERKLRRLADNAIDSRRLASFFYQLERGMEAATARTLELLRRLALSDVGQIQQLLLSFEGEPTGSYLVDVFDRVLQHEIEADTGIIEAAIQVNEFSAIKYPPRYVAGTAGLQELVERTLTQNPKRLRLPGATGSSVAFGDVLAIAENADVERLKSILLVDMNQEKVLLVLTPACDLQREGVPRILLLVGTKRPLSVQDWSYEDDARTPVMHVDGIPSWIKWDLKHIDTVSHGQLGSALEIGDLRIISRLREAHVLELQQRVLSGLGRVGMLAKLPATFQVDVEFYFANGANSPERLDIDALQEGATCYVGRDAAGNAQLRLLMTELCSDQVLDAYGALDELTVAQAARTAFGHINQTDDLQNLLMHGVDLRAAKDNEWSHIKSLTGADNGVPKMGLLAWNYEHNCEALHARNLNKAGVIILVKDRDQDENVGFDAAVKNGLIQPGSN